MADGISLLDALREELGCHTVKDGCSPQGQCGCCTVWVDGAPRVSCVTPVRRVASRTVITLEGLGAEQRGRWADAFVAHGASQCGFCTPGIVLRLCALEAEHAAQVPTRGDIEAALRAHLCRCTGWQSIVDAACHVLGVPDPSEASDASVTAGPADPLSAAWRAELEGATSQSSGTGVVLGRGSFADDTAPAGAHVQLGQAAPLAPSMRAARAGRGRVQGRNSTVPLSHPLEVPAGDWALTLRTTWVEPAYVEPDASWSRPGGPPASPLANGGAFGGKRHSPVPARALELADAGGEAVRVLWRREDVVRHGPKRPPLAVALRPDGSGRVRIGRTAGSADLRPVLDVLESWCPDVEPEMVDVAGPPVAPDLRGAVWAELLAARAVLRADPGPAGTGVAEVSVPGGGRARVALDVEGSGRGHVAVDVWAGAALCGVTLRSYALGAVHQALGLVWSEGIAVDDTGVPVDLTIRSFGILAAPRHAHRRRAREGRNGLAGERLGCRLRGGAGRRLDRRRSAGPVADPPGHGPRPLRDVSRSRGREEPL